MTDPSLTVACVMLSKGRGGLEQSVIDDCAALVLERHRVIALVHPDWPGRADLAALPVVVATVRSCSEWDPWAVRRLRRLLARAKPSVVLTMGRRAGVLTGRARRRLPQLPQVARTPNDRLARLRDLEHVLATTDHIRAALIAAGQPADRISVIPHLVRVPEHAAAARPQNRTPLTIGALGRLEPKKGFADLIDAVALLRDRGIPCTAKLGGAGSEAGELRARVEARGLGDRFELVGWVTDKARFFAQLDILCVPSVQEGFGIVVLEGMAHGVPVVVTDAEGPRTIVTHGVDGLVVPRNDPAGLAAALARLLDDPDLRSALATAALVTTRARYDLPVVARQMSATLRAVVARHAALPLRPQ